MTSILIVIGRIYRYQFKCKYLKNQTHFALILLQVYMKFWTFWKKTKQKKNEPHSFSALVFLKLLSPKDVVT